MTVRTGKYILRSDRFGLWIEEEFIGKDKNGKERTSTRQVAGFCTSFDSLIEDFLDKKIKDSDAQGFEEAIKAISDATKEAKEIVKAATKGKFGKDKR